METIHMTCKPRPEVFGNSRTLLCESPGKYTGQPSQPMAFSNVDPATGTLTIEGGIGATCSKTAGCSAIINGQKVRLAHCDYNSETGKFPDMCKLDIEGVAIVVPTVPSTQVVCEAGMCSAMQNHEELKSKAMTIVPTSFHAIDDRTMTVTLRPVDDSFGRQMEITFPMQRAASPPASPGTSDSGYYEALLAAGAGLGGSGVLYKREYDRLNAAYSGLNKTLQPGHLGTYTGIIGDNLSEELSDRERDAVLSNPKFYGGVHNEWRDEYQKFDVVAPSWHTPITQHFGQEGTFWRHTEFLHHDKIPLSERREQLRSHHIGGAE